MVSATDVATSVAVSPKEEGIDVADVAEVAEVVEVKLANELLASRGSNSIVLRWGDIFIYG